MPTTPLRRLAATLALVVALGAGLVACSSSDDAQPAGTTTPRGSTTSTADGPPSTLDDDVADATAADYVAALEENFGRSGGVFSAEGVSCLASSWVDTLGVETFQEAGVAPADVARNQADLGDLELDRRTATALADAFADCGLELRDAYLKTLEGNLSEQGKVCVDEMLTAEVVRQAFVAELMGEELDPDPLLQVERCTR